MSNVSTDNKNDAVTAQPISSVHTDGVQPIAAQTTGLLLTTPCSVSKTQSNHWHFILVFWV